MARDRRPSTKRSVANGGNGDTAVAEAPETQPYRYYSKGEKPRADAAFFELLIARVVLANGSLAEFDDIWPRAVQALAGFNVFRLANLSGQEITDAIQSVGGGFTVRLAGKSDVLIKWAESFWRIHQVYGSFRQYIRSFDNDGVDALVSDMKQRLPGLTPDFLAAYLREAGEKIPTAAPANRPAGQRGRRRGARGGNTKSRSKAAAPKPAVTKSESAKPGETKSSGRARRGRRRFFRRRGGKAKSPAATTE